MSKEYRNKSEGVPTGQIQDNLDIKTRKTINYTPLKKKGTGTRVLSQIDKMRMLFAYNEVSTADW